MNLAGIDIAHQHFDLQLRCARQRLYRQFDNTAQGHRQCVRWLRQFEGPTRVCLEATGVYHLPLALVLQRTDGIELMVVNPRASRRFAEAQMRRAKTDKVDAGVLLQYLECLPFTPWQAPEAAVLELQSLAHRLGQVSKERIREGSRLHAARCAGGHTRWVQQDIRAHLKQLQARSRRLEQRLHVLIQQHTSFAEDFSLIDSIPGFAAKAAAQVLAELKPLPKDMTARQWTAQAGLDPRPQESGTARKPPRRISKQGNARLRAALFFPAMVASRHDPNVRAFYNTLVQRGKSKRQAQVAVMRKLLHAIWGILHHRQPWNGQRFFHLTTN